MENEIIKIVKYTDKLKIKSYKIFEENGEVCIDVYNNVNLSYMGLREIPIKFRYVYGYFDISNNLIKSLKNSPLYCEGFNCSYNNLTSLAFMPYIIRGEFNFTKNQIDDYSEIKNLILTDYYIINNKASKELISKFVKNNISPFSNIDIDDKYKTYLNLLNEYENLRKYNENYAKELRDSAFDY